jgi:DUF971 family protein
MTDLPSQRSSFDDTTVPRDLKVRMTDQRLVIDWRDGLRSEYSLYSLRRACPCATCRTEREEQAGNPLRILKADPAGVRVVHAELVGSYAIKFRWSDGHDTGIFDFRMLRALASDPPST